MACQCLYSILPAHPCPKSLFQSIFLLTQFAFWKFFILTPLTSQMEEQWLWSSRQKTLKAQ